MASVGGGWQIAGVQTSVYVHFPWCARKCPYCDFASYRMAPAAVPHARYADAVLRELERRADAVRGRELASVFFGGGTPSMWAPAELGRVLHAIRGAFGAAERRSDEALEVTVECNPASLDRAGAAALREAGVNRLSIGVQALRDERLRFLGRMHDREGALAAVRAALETHERVSVDLMFGTPGQRVDDFADEIREALDLGIQHVSAYALTIEPGTVFGDMQRAGTLRIATDDEYAALFAQTERAMGARGLEHYEVSNYAAPGERSRHNEHYWRGGAYLGLGAGAVGCLDAGPGTARRYRNTADTERYMGAGDLAETEAEDEHLDGDALVREALMLGLRTDAGVDLADVERRSGRPVPRGRERAIERRLAQGDLLLTGDHLRVPRARWLHLDGIIADVF